jgi:hypothetical protein
MKSCKGVKKDHLVLSKEHKIYIYKNKNPPTRPILFPNQDENLNINFMWPNSELDLVRYRSQFCCENKVECKQTVGEK